MQAQRCNGFKSGGKPCTLSGEAAEGNYFYCHHHKDQKENVQTSSFPFTYHGNSCESIVKKSFFRIFHGMYWLHPLCQRYHSIFVSNIELADAENCRIGDPSQSRINGPKLVSGVLAEVLRMCFKDGDNLVQRIGEDNILKLDWEWKLVLNYCWRRPGG